jgi:hypothetical protein
LYLNIAVATAIVVVDDVAAINFCALATLLLLAHVVF